MSCVVHFVHCCRNAYSRPNRVRDQERPSRPESLKSVNHSAMSTFSPRRKSEFGSRRNGKCCHDLDFNVTVKSFCVASCLGVHDAGVMCCRILASTDGDLVDGFVSFRLRHRIYYVKLLLLNGSLPVFVLYPSSFSMRQKILFIFLRLKIVLPHCDLHCCCLRPWRADSWSLLRSCT